MNEPTWHRTAAERGEPVEIIVDDTPVIACGGETVAVAMLAAGADFDSDRGGAPRAPLCNMGTCFECVAVVNGRPLTRTCLTPVADGMRVETTRRS